MSTLTWLHLSDWHEGREGTKYDMEIIRERLVKDIEARAEISGKLRKVDFVIFSGDITFSGEEKQYESAIGNFLDPVLRAVGLPSERLFIIPGNHDLNQASLKYVPALLQRPLGTEQEAKQLILDERMKVKMLEPFEAYTAFASKYTPHFASPYASYHSEEINGQRIAFLGLNSALMCGRYKDSDTSKINDYGRLVVGEPQVMTAIRKLEAENPPVDIVIGILHHPFEWLEEYDRDRVEDLLSKYCHFVLRGHVHKQRAYYLKGIYESVTISAGAAFSRRVEGDPRYTNAYNYAHIELSERTGTIYLRRWNDEIGEWRAVWDPYQGGKLDFRLPKSLGDAPLPVGERNTENIGTGTSGAGQPVVVARPTVEDIRRTVGTKQVRTRLFIGHSYKDASWLEKFLIEFGDRVTADDLLVFNETQVRTGARAHSGLDQALTSAKLALLLVTQDFLDTPFIRDLEVVALLERALKEGLTILWVVIKSSRWQLTFLNRIQALGNPGKPLEDMPAFKQSEAVKQMSEYIISMLKQDPRAEGADDEGEPCRALVEHLSVLLEEYKALSSEYKAQTEEYETISRQARATLSLTELDGQILDLLATAGAGEWSEHVVEQDFLVQVLKNVVEGFDWNVQRASILLPDRTGEYLLIRATYGDDAHASVRRQAQFYIGDQPNESHGLAGVAYVTNKPQISRVFQHLGFWKATHPDYVFVGKNLEEPQYKSVVTVPIRGLLDDVLGVLAVDSTEATAFEGREALDILLQIAERLGHAIMVMRQITSTRPRKKGTRSN
ncbi:MAG TPA: metallophosphoesterase [Chloroflexia bacterium]|nr:metallophosphoesterase [Chloroflexia bacterium]